MTTTKIAEPPFTRRVPPRSPFRRKRFLVPFALFSVIALTCAAALIGSGTIWTVLRPPRIIEGLLASKAEFFTDPEVGRILMRHGYQVHVTRVGSRQIASSDLDRYDFAFPSGQPAALLIKARREQEHKYSRAHKPFFSPIVIGAFREYAEALERAGVAKPQPGPGRPQYYNLELDGFVGLSQRTWADFGVDNRNRILAQSPDVCRSNSGGVYLGLVAFVENGNNIPQNDAQALALADRIKPLLTAQGMPAEDVSQMFHAPEGKGLAPVAVFYEHQHLSYQTRVRATTGAVDQERVLLYPAAQLQTVPELIALTPEGDEIGDLITRVPELRQRALELGFRLFNIDGTLASGQLSDFLTARGVPVPETGNGDTETFLPTLPLLEKMIVRVGDCAR